MGNMNKELSDRVWKILPKEFKEEVKKMFEEDKKHPEIHTTCGITTAYHNNMGQRLIDLFGLHNLTSDAEGEVMLTVSANTVRAYKENIDKYLPSAYSAYDKGFWTGQKAVFEDLFGSKCLTDKGPKPAEPKFKYNIGQKVKSVFANEIMTIKEHCGRVGHDNVYKVEEYAYTWNECELRPCTEPKKEASRISERSMWDIGRDESEATKLVKSEPIETCTETCTDDCSSQCSSQDFDTIIKDGFSKERRLNIAAMMMQGMLSNTTRFSSYEISDLVRISLNCADALIAELEKGGLQ